MTIRFCCVPMFAPRLTFKFPTWRWEAGDANLRASYLPQEQQYLITRRGLQCLKLLGMSKQGKMGTHADCWPCLKFWWSRCSPGMYPAKTGSELLGQLVCLHNLSLDLSADLTTLTRDSFFRGTWFCFRPDQDRGCFKSCIRMLSLDVIGPRNSGLN